MRGIVVAPFSDGGSGLGALDEPVEQGGPVGLAVAAGMVALAAQDRPGLGSGAPGGYSRGWWLPVRICPAVSQVQARSVCRSAAATRGGPVRGRTGPSACRVADGRAGGRADIGLRGRDASRATRAAGCQVGRVA